MQRKLHTRMSFFNAEGTLERNGHNHSFIIPTLSSQPITLTADDVPPHEECIMINKLKNTKATRAIFEDIGKTYYDGITAKVRVPAPVSYFVSEDIHQQTAAIGPGVIDMKIKSSGSDDIILPEEFKPLSEMIRISATLEKYLNPEYKEWSMWLLVDRRPAVAGTTQRNGGAHCDGFRMSQPYLQQTAVYTWCNTLPTEGTTAAYPLPKNFDPLKHNFSSVLTRDWDESTTLDTEPYFIYRMDGHTPHRGKVSDRDIDNRVFIRICFTPPGKEFNRKGNTPNPCMDYPDNYWVTVHDPASRLANITDFETPNQFIRMWENACQGHSSYGILGSGKNSHEQQLVEKLKKCGPVTLHSIFKKYENTIDELKQQNKSSDVIEMSEMRLALLKNKVF